MRSWVWCLRLRPDRIFWHQTGKELVRAAHFSAKRKLRESAHSDYSLQHSSARIGCTWVQRSWDVCRGKEHPVVSWLHVCKGRKQNLEGGTRRNWRSSCAGMISIRWDRSEFKIMLHTGKAVRYSGRNPQCGETSVLVGADKTARNGETESASEWIRVNGDQLRTARRIESQRNYRHAFCAEFAE